MGFNIVIDDYSRCRRCERHVDVAAGFQCMFEGLSLLAIIRLKPLCPHSRRRTNPLSDPIDFLADASVASLVISMRLACSSDSNVGFTDL